MHSFTFNSEPEVELVAADGPLSIRSVMVIIAALVVGFYSCKGLAEFHQPGSWKILRDTDWANLKVIILGDSTEAAAVDATLLSEPSMNLSVSGSGFSTWLPVLKGVLPRAPMLETVVISCDPMSVLRDGLGPRKGDMSDLVLRGTRVQDLHQLTWREKGETFIRYKTGLSLVLSRKRIAWPGLISLMKEGRMFPSAHVFESLPSEGSSKKKMYFKMFAENKHVSENETALKSMLEIFKENNLRIVWVRTPVTQPFFEEGQDEWEAHTVKILDQVREFFPKEEIQVFNEALLFPDDLEKFNDPNHVSASGRKIFTDALDHFLLHKELETL
jgi:hypothetical protein